MPHRNDDDDDDRPRKRRTQDEDDKVEVRRMSQARPATSDVEDDRPKPKTRPSAADGDDDRPKPKAKASSAFDDDDEDRPKSKSRRAADDDEDDRPKPKAKVSSAFDDDDEDRPKSKSRRAADDEEDDRPKTKSRRVPDDDDDDRPSKRARRDYDEDDDDEPQRKKKKKPVKKQLNVVGLIALVIGIGSFIVAFTPCVPALFALIPAIVGVIVAGVGLFIANQSKGRQGMGLPISGGSLNVVVILIAVAWMVFMKQVDKEFEKVGKEWEAEVAKEQEREAQRKVELAKAGPEVKNAQPGSIIRVSATQFYRAYDNDPDAADRMYMNKILEVTGTIQSVDLDEDGESDTYLVRLRAGREEFESVECEFAKDPGIRAQLAALRPGTQITIRGKCLGDDSAIEACIFPPAGGQ